MPIPFNVIMHSDMWSYAFCETTKFHITTRLHSSRMPTTNALTISPSMLCSGGVCFQGDVCYGGSLPPGGCLLQGVSAPGVSASGGCLLQGGIPACTEADTPLWTEFLTHAYENITLPKLRLRAVLNWLKQNVDVSSWGHDWLWEGNVEQDECYHWIYPPYLVVWCQIGYDVMMS